MKHIVKRADIPPLRAWKAENKHTSHVIEYNYGGFPIEEVKSALLEDQFYLCAYTMLRIRMNDSHIEHVNPQSHTKLSKETKYLETEYGNMLACFPDAASGKGVCEFGAVAKGSTVPTTNNFVSPLQADCEVRFSYRSDGSVTAASNTDVTAQACLDILKLSHPSLKELRQRAFQGFGILRRSRRPLSATAARRLAATIVKPRSDHTVAEFCIAVKQVALLYADNQEARGSVRKKIHETKRK